MSGNQRPRCWGFDSPHIHSHVHIYLKVKRRNSSLPLLEKTMTTARFTISSWSFNSFCFQFLFFSFFLIALSFNSNSCFWVMNDCEMDGDYDDVTVRNLLKGEWEWERVREMTLWWWIDKKNGRVSDYELLREREWLEWKSL